MTLLFLILSLFSCQPKNTEIINGDLNIIPLPMQMEGQSGSFMIDEDTWIQSDSFPNATFDPIKVFEENFKRKSGYSIPRHNEKLSKNDEKHVILIVRSGDHNAKEDYTLHISTVGIIINASNEVGVFYALQTLRQIMRMDGVPDADGVIRSWNLPAVDIVDKPAFSYRGMHLDVCRHIFPVEFVKKYVDLLAYYKMNRFHWHLTDDQGWRIEIKQYPKLQEIAAWRAQTLVGKYGAKEPQYDGQRYGGYYTQTEIKEVVQYAKDRGVMVIPEIEMPGHALAALTAYPELSCTGGPFKVAASRSARCRKG